MSKVEKNEVNSAKCFCPNCPSYNACSMGKKESLFCAGEIGKSSCPYSMNGCICGGCPVHTASLLKNGYYCLNGSAEEIG